MAGEDTHPCRLACCWYTRTHIYEWNNRSEHRNRDGYKYNNTWNRYACPWSRYTYANIYPYHYDSLCATGCADPPVIYGDPLATKPAGTINYAEDNRQLWETRNVEGNRGLFVDTTFKLDRQ